MIKPLLLGGLTSLVLLVGGWIGAPYLVPETNLGLAVLTVPQGGTGNASFTSGECLKGNGANALTTGPCGSSGGSGSISTSSPGVVSSLLYFTTAGATPELVNPVATTTLTASSPLSLSAAVAKVGGSNSVLSLDTSGAWSGTAGSLAANGANCSAGNFPLGVDNLGAVETCADAWTEAENTAAGYSGFPFTSTSNFGTTTSATSTPLWLRGNQYSLFASSTAVFDKASTTLLSVDTIYDLSDSSIIYQEGELRASAGVLYLAPSGGQAGQIFYDSPNSVGLISGDGTYALYDQTVTDAGVFNLTALSADRTYTLPNLTGVPALGSYTTGFTVGHIPFGSSGLLATSSALSFDGTRLNATYASSTAVTISGTASTSKFFADGLATCNTENMLTWSGGTFGCESDTSSAGGSSGSVATSTNEVADQIAVFTSNSATPALVGGSVAFTYNPATKRATIGTTSPSALATLTVAATSTDTTFLLSLLNDTAAVVASVTDEGAITALSFTGALDADDITNDASDDDFLDVAAGGTGVGTLTDGGVLIGNGTGDFVAMSVLADGSIIVGDGTTDPVALAAFESSTGDLSVTAGGTGVSTLTDGGLLIGKGTADVTALAVLADGSIVVGDGTTDPVALAAFESSTGDLAVTAGGSGVSTLTGILIGNGASDFTADAVPLNVSNGGIGVTTFGGVNTVLFTTAADTLAADATNFVYNTALDVLGIGTSTPRWPVQIASSTRPQLALSDGSLTSDHWTLRNINGTLYVATSSPSTFATSTSAAVQVQAGNTALGIATTSPWRTLSVVGTVAINGLTAASGVPSSVCINATTKEVTENAALTCTVSSVRFKHDIGDLTVNATSIIEAITPASFKYNETDRERWGFIAEDLAAIDKRLADGWDEQGRPNSIDQNAILAVVVSALKSVFAREDNIEKRLDALEMRVTSLEEREKAWESANMCKI